MGLQARNIRVHGIAAAWVELLHESPGSSQDAASTRTRPPAPRFASARPLKAS